MALLPQLLYAFQDDVGLSAESLTETMISAGQMMKLFAALPGAAVLVQIINELGNHARQRNAVLIIDDAQPRELGVEFSGIQG